MTGTEQHVGRPGLRAAAVAIALGGIVMTPPFFTGALGLQIRADLGIGATALGAAISTFFIATALLSPALGRLVDRIGPLRGVQLAALTAAVALLGIGTAVPTAGWLVALLVVGGVANALGGPTASLLISRGVAPGRQALAFGLKQAAVPAGTLLGGLAVPLIALTVGWRWAFVTAAGLALFVAVAAGPGARHTPMPQLHKRTGTVHRRPLLFAAAAFLCTAAAATGLGAFVVDLAVSRGMGEGGAGLLLAGMSVVAVVIRIGTGWLADRPGAEPARLAIGLQSVGAAGFLLLVPPLGVSAVIIGSVLAFGGGWGWTGLLAHGVVRGNPDGPATATGMVQTGGASGGMVGPFLLGALTEHVSHSVAWGVGAALSLLALGMVIATARGGLLPRTEGRPPLGGATR